MIDPRLGIIKLEDAEKRMIGYSEAVAAARLLCSTPPLILTGLKIS